MRNRRISSASSPDARRGNRPLDGTRTVTYVRYMCDLSRDEQGALIALLGDLQAAEVKMAATYPEVFTRAWADHEAMLASLDDMASAVGRVRDWVTAKHHAM